MKLNFVLSSRKTKKTFVNVAGHRTFRVRTDYNLEVQQIKYRSNPLVFPDLSDTGFVDKLIYFDTTIEGNGNL